MTKKITHLALALVTLLTGCSMIPTYERPAAPVPTGFPNVTASERHSTLPSWRTYFAEPRLQQLIELALNNNRDLRIASLNVEQARAQFQVRRAAQYPAVGLAANASRAPASGTGNITNNFSVGLAVTAWELDFFGRVASLKEQALAQYLATEEGRNAAQVSLISSVANGWLNLLADEELLELSRRTLATREESVRLTKLRLDSGAASELDYRQAESLAQAARTTLAQQQRQRALDENALALLLGQPLPEDIRATLGRSDLNAAPVIQAVPAGLPSDLLVQRPDIRQAEQQLIAANANIGAARAAMCAAGMGSNACASGCTSGSRVCDIGGGAPTCTHSGQSSVWLGMSCAPSSVLTTSLTAPEPRQINSTGLGWTKGDATATPIDNTNHANTRRASHRRLRRVCRGRGGMWRDCRRPLRRAG